VSYLQQAWQVSENRACRIIKLSKTTFRYQRKRCDPQPLMARITEIAYARIRYGYERIYILLGRQGWHIHHKRAHRLYCLLGLNLRYRKPRRHKASLQRIMRLPATKANECWSMDFVCD